MSPRERAASVLLVDIGNTRIKWAVWRGGELGRTKASEHAAWSAADYAQNIFQGAASRTSRIVVSSVAGRAAIRRLTAAARRVTGLTPELVATSRRAAGVRTRYAEPWRLGVDRFMGVIAAHHLAGTRGACVINVGTAVTVDYVDDRGVHQGGAILPGPRLMIGSLLRGTAGIAHRAQEGPARPGGQNGARRLGGPDGARGAGSPAESGGSGRSGPAESV
ncbi:MAG: type III pantothenate kinase, partial [Steroidobacteraceae bacterium]